MKDDPNPSLDFLERYVADRDVPCPGCGYNLRGLKEAVCPECGLALTIGSVVEPIRRKHRRRYFAGRAAAAVSFALGILILGTGLPRVFDGGDAVKTVAGAVALIQSLMWLTLTRRVSEMSRANKARLAILMWVVVGLVVFVGL